MEFLVTIQINLQADITHQRRQALYEEEHTVGQRYRSSGVISRIWRIPGTSSNVGVWTAGDADELHELLSGLPLFPWMNVAVMPLATHPLEAT
jgi:muconolactone D-isomerase